MTTNTITMTTDPAVGASRVTAYPRPTVALIGTDGNAFAILGNVQRALRDAGATPDDVAAYNAEATAGDYDHLLAVTMKWVDVA